jgi:Mn2+/Fe2+ NRAMP family transporter
MPHNLYLHTSIVQTRLIGKDLASKQDAVNWRASTPSARWRWRCWSTRRS